MPILDAWEAMSPLEWPNYAAGSWGPEDAEALIGQDGRSWFQPTAQAGAAAEEGCGDEGAGSGSEEG
jgi:glucose-6-phosphate 1-dehydrogenase